MFENLLYQKTSNLLAQDIKQNKLPGSILLSGPASSGKLTCALEIARILSCSASEPETEDGHGRGGWLCECNSCKKNKEIANTNILLAGPRDCSLEIAAARKTLIEAASQNVSYLQAARYLFIRAVRKLTMRFSQVLWETDDKLSKIADFTQAIDEQLELLDIDRPLPEDKALQKICDTIVTQTTKLESEYMVDSLPVAQMRNASAWARTKAPEGKKIFIIENVDRMLDSVRNAMLKILEEPPEDTVFILTTTRRGSIMPTILSRVRTYTFVERSESEQKEVIQRVFHDFTDDENHSSISSYLQTFLPVQPSVVIDYAQQFYEMINNGGIPQVSPIVKGCASFNPRILLKIFLNGIITAKSKKENITASQTESKVSTVSAIRECYNNVTVYNQSPAAALEKLVRDIASIRRVHGEV